MAEKRTGKEVAAGETWITVRVPDEVKAWLDEFAARRERSVSFLVRRLLVRAHATGEQFREPDPD